MIIATLIPINCFLLVISCYDDVKRNSNQLRSAANFAFQGIGFHSTKQEIMKKWPKSQSRIIQFETDKNMASEPNFLMVNVESICVTEKIDNVPMILALYDYYDGRVVKITIVYDKIKLEDAGDDLLIERELIRIIGDPNYQSTGKVNICDWELDSVKRKFTIISSDTLVMLEAYDTGMDDIIARKKEAILLKK